MPLDGHAYLVSQGWSGKGTGLRHGAISRPVTLAQKKNLAGIGKDRDEAFPFWDHVFSAAASKIKIPVSNSDDESDDAPSTSQANTFAKTRTGIISNRRPTAGTPIDSGSTTPNASSSGTNIPRLSVMAAAKQEAARRVLYSMFYRGPVMKSDDEVLSVEEIVKHEVVAIERSGKTKKSRSNKVVAPDEAALKTEKVNTIDEPEAGSRSKKRRRLDGSGEGARQSKEDRKAAKRERKEEKRRLKAARKGKEIEKLDEVEGEEVFNPANQQEPSVSKGQSLVPNAESPTEPREPAEPRKEKRKREKSSL